MRDPFRENHPGAAPTLLALALASALLGSMSARAVPAETTSIPSLASGLKEGDIVFIRVPFKPFLEISRATGSWTNHVGIVVDVAGREPRIAESRFPLSSTTTLSRFVARSEEGRVAVARLREPLTPEQQQRLFTAAHRRLGVFYDTGFDLHSHRQFCSRYVREVLQEATGVQVGEVESFATLLSRRPDTDLGFWKLWYFGQIPWQRETVTPASLLGSAAVQVVFDGAAKKDRAWFH